MRRALLAAFGLILLTAVAGSTQEQSVAEAARKAREKKKDAPKAAKVFTNDNLPQGGTVSVVGGAAPAPEAAKEGGEKAAEGEPKDPAKDEAGWRARFADMRTKIRQAEKELDILQREFNLIQQQYYSDPNKALREQLERKEINEHRKKIEDKQAELRQLRQQLADLEDELRRAGGPPAWARE
jgi:chromosome segregation ATPase